MPFGIGRSLKRAGRAVAKPFEQAADEVGRVGERIGNEAERIGGKLVSEKYKKELRRARDITINVAERTVQSSALNTGSASAAPGTYLGYEDTVVEEEQEAYRRQQRKEEEQRAKKEQERGQELLRRRRTRRLGSPFASGFGSASTGYKTVLGI